MTHEERARKMANLINSQKFSGLLEDLLDAQFAEVDETARRLGYDAGWETATNALKTEQARLQDRIAILEAALEKADALADMAGEDHDREAGTNEDCALCRVSEAYQAARAKVKP